MLIGRKQQLLFVSTKRCSAWAFLLIWEQFCSHSPLRAQLGRVHKTRPKVRGAARCHGACRSVGRGGLGVGWGRGFTAEAKSEARTSRTRWDGAEARRLTAQGSSGPLWDVTAGQWQRGRAASLRDQDGCRVNYYTRSQYLTGLTPCPSDLYPDSTEGRAKNTAIVSSAQNMYSRNRLVQLQHMWSQTLQKADSILFLPPHESFIFSFLPQGELPNDEN